MKQFIIQGALLLLSASLFGQSNVWSPAQGGNGHYYEVITTPQIISWTDARDAAAAKGGYLATVTSAAEDAFIQNLASNSPIWLGGFQPAGSSEPSGGWRWVTSEPFSYTNWLFSEPSDNGLSPYGPENYVQAYFAYYGRWGWNDLSDFNPNAGHPRYVIEYPTPVTSPPPHYTQGSGAAWANDRLLGSPNADDTMRKYGCFVSSASMILNSYGHHTDPGKLNQFLSQAIPNDNASLAFGSIPTSDTYGQTDGTTGIPVSFHTRKFELSLTRSEIASKIGLQIGESGPVLLRVPQYNDGLEHFPNWQHAIVAWKVQGDEIFIRDPGSARSGLPLDRHIDSLTLDDYVSYVNGSVETAAFRLDSNFQFLLGGQYTFARPVTSATPSTVRGAAHSPIEFVITDPLGRRFGFNPTLSVTYDEIPDSIYERVSFIISPDGELMPTSGTDAPIDFELGTLVSGTYTLDVYGIGVGDWSINLGLNDSSGFDPDQFLFSGVASSTSHQQFTFFVPEPTTLFFSFLGLGVLLSKRRMRTNGT
jgi:Lectin C-type domain